MTTRIMRQPWLVFTLLCFAVIYVSFVYDARRESPAARRLRNADIPVSVEALKAKYSPEPVEENGAFLYMEAMNKLALPEKSMMEHLPYEGDLQIEYGHEFTPQQRDALHKYVAMNAEPIALILEAQKKPFTRLPVDSRYSLPETNPYLVPSRQLARLVSCAALDAALSGDMTTLGQMGIAELRLYEIVSEGAPLIEEISAIYMCRIGIENLEESLFYLRPTESVIYHWQKILSLERYATFRYRKEVFKNEMTFSFQTYEYEGPFYYWPNPNTWDKAVVKMVFEWTQYNYIPQNTFILFMETIIDATDRDVYEAVQMHKEELLHYTWENNLRNFIPWMMSSTYIDMYRLYAQHIARATTAQSALASLLYLEDHGHLPETLEELVPDYLPSPPRDPFTPNGTIQYCRSGNHLLFYSIGPDEKDNDGTEPEGPLLKGGDIIFRLTLPEGRHDES